MIQVILGSKGSGKTKRLIDITNDALKVEHGNVVFIDDDKRYMYDLRHEIRFVDASEYPVARLVVPLPLGAEWVRSVADAAQENPSSEVRGCNERRYPVSEIRGSGREEQPHAQGAMAVRAQEGLEELSQVEGQEGRW